jgi:crossover junction endodeoxyribonuclease RuvC
MRIISIDPGFERLGIAVLERDKKTRKEILLHSECFKTKASLPFSERLSLLGNRVREIIKKFEPEALAIETLFFTANQKTAMKVSEARGVVVYEAARSGLAVHEYTPLQIKIAVTGYGKATKNQVNDMVSKLIAIPKKISSDDEMDAIACGVTCLAHVRS